MYVSKIYFYSSKIDDFQGFFRQITSPNVIASQVKLTELFEILLKIPNHFDNVDSFHPENIPGCVQSCLDHVSEFFIQEIVHGCSRLMMESFGKIYSLIG